MKHRLVIIGAGGHAKVIADIAMKNGYGDIRFLDDRATGECMGFPIVGTGTDAQAMDDGSTDFVVAIGSNSVRKNIAERFELPWVTLIHPSAQIAAGVSIGAGTVVMAGAVLNAAAHVGSHCIINTCAVVEHDSVLEDYVHISPRAALGGTVRVGTLTHIGIGAVVRNNMEICGNCVVGAGAAVVKNIDCGGTYIGVPARRLDEKYLDPRQQ